MPITIRGHGQKVVVKGRKWKASVKERNTWKVSVATNRGSLLPYYEGEYEVTPTPDEQELATANKSMHRDVLVHAIPYHSVTNEAGGYTVSIAS